LTGLSQLVRVLAQSLIVAVVPVGCSMTEIYEYPRSWPVIGDAPQRCAIEGEYVNEGVVEPAIMGVSTDGSGRHLNALLRSSALGPIGSLSTDRVRIAVTASTLMVTVPGEPLPVALPMLGDLSTCLEEGSYQIEFSKPYADEAGAGILHITRALTLAGDGSLVVRSTLFFDGSRSFIFSHKNERVVWYRFMRIGQSQGH
jgi:hypothetical protein